VEEEGGHIDQLTRNHRSREAILRAVDAVMDGAEGVEPNPLEAAREFVPAEVPSVEIIEAAPAAEDGDPAALEAQWVARRIRELEGTLPVADKNTKGATRPARFSDIAVLVRNTRSLDNLEQAFRDFSVPFLMNRGRAFFDELEITDLVAWLRILANPRDEAALTAVLRSPFVGLSGEGLLRLRLAGGGLASGIREFEPSPEWPASEAENLSRFLALFRELRALRDNWPPDRLLARAIDACGYEEGALPRERANIDKFLQLLRDWHSRRPRSCRELVERLEALREDTVEPSAPANDTPDAVQVLTVHAAKGLEFPVVFLAGMHLGMKVERPPLLYARPHGLGVLWRDPGDGHSLPDLAHNLIWNEIRGREAEEANRLLYVAMTRAEEHLVMSYAATERRSPWPDLISRALPELVRRLDRTPEKEVPARQASVSAEPEALPAPRASGNHDSTASVSALLQFAACPRQYYLQRYLGWQPRADPGAFALPSEDEEKADTELSPTELGTAVHAILAGDPPDAHPPEALELASRFTASPLGAWAARAERSERELDFVFALEGIVLRGQIDLWFEENGLSVLVDYKTDRYDAARADHYAIQLQLYALALGGFTGRVPDEAWLCFLRADEPVRVPVDEAALEGARELVRRFREAQNRLAFPLREGPHCFHCGFYRGLCPR
jgi:ATP-dependent exoDNAse (exonuclease V) beta subunit